jgi:hypothetical protein
MQHVFQWLTSELNFELVTVKATSARPFFSFIYRKKYLRTMQLNLKESENYLGPFNSNFVTVQDVL